MHNTFNDDSDHCLSHHGILGQKWGKQNGPPYPLSDVKHKLVVRRAEKRKNKILSNPKKLYKHSDEFTIDEINDALLRIDTRNKIKDRIPKKVKAKPPVKLSPRKKKWAKSAVMLEKHMDKYRPEEFKRALEILDGSHRIYDKKMSELERPKKILDLGNAYLKTFINTFGNIKDGKKLFTDNNAKLKWTDDQRRVMRVLWGKEYSFDEIYDDPVKRQTMFTLMKNKNADEILAKLKEM